MLKITPLALFILYFFLMATEEGQVNLEIQFLFPKNAKYTEGGFLRVGIYSSRDAYDLITELDKNEINRDNLLITDEIWDNYFTVKVPVTEEVTVEKMVSTIVRVNPNRKYGISVFYDRNQNDDFNLFSYPKEYYGFSNFNERFIYRKADFEEIAFSPSNQITIRLR